MSTIYYYEPIDLDRYLNTINLGRQGGEFENKAKPTLKPRMDLYEDMKNNLVEAVIELPGFRKEDVSIDVQNGRLTITAESKPLEGLEGRNYAVHERQPGKYSRTIILPQGIKEDDIKASMENGLLKISFPKSAPETPPKKISIA